MPDMTFGPLQHPTRSIESVTDGGVRVVCYGSGAVAGRLAGAFGSEGLDTRLLGDPPVEERGAAHDAGVWFTMYVVGRVADHADKALGGHVDRSTRVLVQTVVDRFRERYPNITIRIED